MPSVCPKQRNPLSMPSPRSSPEWSIQIEGSPSWNNQAPMLLVPSNRSSFGLLFGQFMCFTWWNRTPWNWCNCIFASNTPDTAPSHPRLIKDRGPPPSRNTTATQYSICLHSRWRQTHPERKRSGERKEERESKKRTRPPHTLYPLPVFHHLWRRKNRPRERTDQRQAWSTQIYY